jgi:hypothetical protein
LRFLTSNGVDTEDSSSHGDDEFMSPENITMGSLSEEDIVRQLETGTRTGTKYNYILDIEQLKSQLPETLRPRNHVLSDKAMTIFEESDDDDSNEFLPAECMRNLFLIVFNNTAVEDIFGQDPLSDPVFIVSCTNCKCSILDATFDEHLGNII